MPYATYRFNKIIAAETIRFIVTVAIVVYKGLKLVVYRMLTKKKTMIRYIEKGDIFRIDGVSSYAHGCNCAGAMGKGIAVQFKSKYPDMYLEYKQLCKENKFCPGDVFDYDYGNGHIYNLGTQATWRTRAKIEYIEKALIQMLELASGDNVTAIALPAIGAGLGGLKWDDVKAIIETVSNDYPNVDLYVVETYQSE